MSFFKKIIVAFQMLAALAFVGFFFYAQAGYRFNTEFSISEERLITCTRDSSISGYSGVQIGTSEYRKFVECLKSGQIENNVSVNKKICWLSTNRNYVGKCQLLNLGIEARKRKYDHALLESNIALARLQAKRNRRYFRDSRCTDDCSGHEAGYEWAQENDIYRVSDCENHSLSFQKGCEIYVDEY